MIHLGGGYEFEADDGADQQEEEEDTPDVGRFAKKGDADQCRAESADAGPNGIGGAERDGF